MQCPHTGGAPGGRAAAHTGQRGCTGAQRARQTLHNGCAGQRPQTWQRPGRAFVVKVRVARKDGMRSIY